jgi:putative ABC transport system substrate-binding protein
MPLVGILMSSAENDSEATEWLSILVQGLKSLGWTDGQNMRIETRWAAGDLNRVQALAGELVDLKSDVIVTLGTITLSAVRQKTHSIPIVFALVNDPVGSGMVASLAHPGGNITGFTNFEYGIAGKWLELLRELSSGMHRVLVIMNPDNSGHSGFVRALENSAHPLAVQVTEAPARSAADIERGVSAFAPGPDAGLIVLPDLITLVNRDLIIRLAAKYRAPATYPYPFFASAGGLLAYGIDTVDLYQRVASYVDRILKGSNPGDLPVQQPTKFELVVNLKTAKAMGLKVSQSFLLLADKVIE